MTLVLSVIAILLAIGGVFRLLRGALLEGAGWLLAAALVGPAGISLFG